ncbi:OTU domain-containing protein 5-A isoform X4 [Hoplias malabaricus]|uniref:OTU domain-containing protein 5-A isoform X4 n=1 Tax=Hoplias malabaricus TaxID=27720 RepID=UPI0034623323
MEPGGAAERGELPAAAGLAPAARRLVPRRARGRGARCRGCGSGGRRRMLLRARAQQAAAAGSLPGGRSGAGGRRDACCARGRRRRSRSGLGRRSRLQQRGRVRERVQTTVRGSGYGRAADQVYGDQDMHEVVRKHCMDYLMKNADYFSNYVTEDFTTYINRKRKNNCHGNHIEMQAMAEMYNRPVEVYQYSTEPINTFHGIHQNNDEPIRVSYHRNIHYNSVVNPNKATIGVGLGLPAFKPGYADQSLMKNAIKTSEESWIEQQMLEDKKRATDWEATNEAIEEQVARESYLQWLRDQEKQARQPRKASATCSSATAAASSGPEEWSARSPRQRSSAPSPENPDPTHSDQAAKPPSPAGAALALSKPPSPCAPGPSNQACVGPDRPTSSSLVSLYPALGYRAIMQDMSPTAFGLTDWEDDEILASVLAVSQQEYLDSMKKNAMHREPSPDSS